jgi:hypothetical protein
VVELKIEKYSFGRMIIDGQNYGNDLMICGDEIKRNWVREEGHLLKSDDLAWIVEKKPDLLIVGKGSSGRMKIDDSARSYLSERGIEIWLGTTDEAVDYFNSKQGGSELVAAAFHLTC